MDTSIDIMRALSNESVLYSLFTYKTSGKMRKSAIVHFVFGFFITSIQGLYENVCHGTACLCQLNTSENILDCTAKHVHIHDVCDSVQILNITVLKAGENNLGQLTEDDLKGCETLTELDLHYNQMTNMSSSVFKSFARLRQLDLSANNLKIYKPNGTFHSSSLPETLHVLYLGGNVPENPRMHHLEYPDLSNLRELQELHMDGIEADFGPEYQYMNIHVISLSPKTRFSYCNMIQITDRTFTNLLSVRTLNISSCNILNISAEAFRNLKYLTTLDLSFNRRLRFNPLGVFSYGLQFTNIKQLNYSYVYPTFGIGTILQISHICYLYNTSLTEILLDGNRMVLIETNAPLLAPKSLERIEINDNHPTFGPYLSQLGCLGNTRTLSANEEDRYHTAQLYLADVDLSDGPYDEKPWPSDCPFMTEEYLKSIQTPNCQYLKRNDFQKIFQFLFPAKLETISGRDSNINYKLNLTLNVKPENNTLQYIDFSGNRLRTMEGPIGPFPKARKVLLSKNYCEYIGPKFFDEMSSIEYLDFSDNYLGPFFAEESSKKVFSNLLSLKELHLKGNKITSLFSETISPLKNLASLILGNNNIKTFDIDLEPSDGLFYLDLKKNFLSSLPLHVMKTLSSYIKRNSSLRLDLSENPLKYECDNTDFIQWLFTSKRNVIGYRNLTFSPKVILDETAINRLQRRCSTYITPIVVSSCVISAFASVVIVGILYRNRWKIRYFLFMSDKDLFGFKKLSDGSDADNYRFSAFISYAEENFQFVVDEIIPKLEEQGLQLCVHERDFVAGKTISDNITEAIRNSRKTVIILSNIFLRKKWCMYEFNMARMESIYSRGDNNHVIVVMLEHVPTNRMPLEMLDWIRTNSYIEYTRDNEGEALFWNNLIHAVSTDAISTFF